LTEQQSLHPCFAIAHDLPVVAFAFSMPSGNKPVVTKDPAQGQLFPGPPFRFLRNQNSHFREALQLLVSALRLPLSAMKAVLAAADSVVRVSPESVQPCTGQRLPRSSRTHPGKFGEV